MFRQLFASSVNDNIKNIPKVIGMIHAPALPGTPGYKPSGKKSNDSGIQEILNQVKREAEIFSKFEGTNCDRFYIMF